MIMPPTAGLVGNKKILYKTQKYLTNVFIISFVSLVSRPKKSPVGKG
jgi:hypothetical protein